MKNIFLMLFVSIGLFTSCVEKPEEDPDTTPAVGDMQIDFDGQHFTSVTTEVVLNDTSLMIKGVDEDGAYFRIAVPSTPVVGTYTWDEFGPTEAGFSLEYHPANGSDPYIAARDDSGEFANFSDYTDTAELVITAIDRTNKRIYGSFKFTGVRFADALHTAINTKVFTSGTFFSLPYTATEVVIPGDNVLVKKIVNSYPGAGIADQTDEFTYIGNKIDKEVYTDSEGFVETTLYTYSGDLITKIESTDIDGLVETETFTYDGDKLVTYVKLDHWQDTGVKETYVHQPDGTILVTRFTGDLTSQTNADGTSTIQFTNSEVSSIGFSSGQVKTYTYDAKKNPFKNVTGWNKIAFVNGEPKGGILKNILQESLGGPLPSKTFTYTYNTTGNAIDYPSTTSISSGVETDVVLTYTYQ